MAYAEVSCAEVVELVTGYLEGTLGPTLHDRVEEHLRACPGCEVYVEQMRVTIGLLGRVPADTLSPQAQRTLLAAFRDWAAE